MHRKGALVLALIVALMGCEHLIVFPHAGYAIGEVGYHTSGRYRATIEFRYTAMGEEFHVLYSNGHNMWTVPSRHISKGTLYMVQFDSLDAGHGRMLFDFYLEDSSQYQTLVDQFRTSPPGPK